MLMKILGRALLVVFGLAGALLFVEVATRVGLRVVRGQSFSSEDAAAAIASQAGSTESRTNNRAGEYLGRVLEVLHPYLGFVPDPSAFEDRTTIGDPGQILTPSSDTFIVGLFGGSFALGVCNSASDELRRALAPPGKTVRFLCLAVGGYKQPQQLLTLTYLLAQGAHFDLVINLDGFNEIALPPENITQGVAPTYPRSWLWRIGNVTDANALKLLGKLSIVDHERKAWAERFAGWHAEGSAFLATVWEKLDRSYANRRAALIETVQNLKVEQRKGYVMTGPSMAFPDDQSLYAYLVRLWKDSSVQMKALCDANHIAYAHFLQPNQHVAGSKPLAPEEERLMKGPSPYRDAVLRGYSLLRQQGEAFRQAGVHFHDLTMAFANHQEPLYNDGCCHLYPAGYVEIARIIGETLNEDSAR